MLLLLERNAEGTQDRAHHAQALLCHVDVDLAVVRPEHAKRDDAVRGAVRARAIDRVRVVAPKLRERVKARDIYAALSTGLGTMTSVLFFESLVGVVSLAIGTSALIPSTRA